MTDLEETNEPYSFEFPILENYSLDSYFNIFIALTYGISISNKSELFMSKDEILSEICNSPNECFATNVLEENLKNFKNKKIK
jgi:hypothetical protein